VAKAVLEQEHSPAAMSDQKVTVTESPYGGTIRSSKIN
jgi:hypothetical protein